MVNGFQERFIITSAPNICGQHDRLRIPPRSLHQLDPYSTLALCIPRSSSPEEIRLCWETHRRLAHGREIMPPSTHARTHTHTCTHVHTHACTHVHTRMRTHAHTHTCTCTHARTHTDTHAHTRAHTCTCAHTCMHTHRHTDMHAHTSAARGVRSRNGRQQLVMVALKSHVGAGPSPGPVQ